MNTVIWNRVITFLRATMATIVSFKDEQKKEISATFLSLSSSRKTFHLMHFILFLQQNVMYYASSKTITIFEITVLLQLLFRPHGLSLSRIFPILTKEETPVRMSMAC